MADATDTPKIPEMVERVARAMWNDCRTYPFRHEYENLKWDALVKIANKETAARGDLNATIVVGMTRRRAKAIAAMREPIPAMNDAGINADFYAQTDPLRPTQIWRAMIDAALRERSQT
jgi:hypothetical protein